MNFGRGLRTIQRRRLTLSTRTISSISDHLSIFPDFLSLREQSVLLKAALQKLDSNTESVTQRRKRRSCGIIIPELHTAPPPQALFYPDEYYTFQEGHFDGVIRNYREMHVTSWPETAGLSSILNRISLLCPSPNTQTHILHLGSKGEILPHIDNVDSSGAWILGVSLGSERVLRLEHAHVSEHHDVSLPSGTIYLQRNTVRYEYKHSILPGKGQRMSIMIRDLPSRPS